MIPLLIVALGGLFSEKSGVVNIALEGKMVLGAFTGTMFIRHIQHSIDDRLAEGLELTGMLNILSNPVPLLFTALLLSALTGVAVSLLHAFASINLKANQVISGVAINMFAPALAIYVAMLVLEVQHVRFTNQFRIESVRVLGDIPILGPILFQNAYITTYLGFLILAVTAFVLYKTKFGLRLRACGEHPQAADSVGVSVAKMRYAGVLTSGVLAGIGGLIWVLPISNEFSGSVGGYGFLALAVLIFGAWKPQRILLASLFFGFMQTIAAANTAIAFLPAIPAQFYRMTPFIATLIVLAFTSKNTMAPKAAGQPYDKGGR